MKRLRSTRARVAVLASLLLPPVISAACAESTGIGPTISVYVARTVNGVDVPAPLRRNENFEHLLLADTIRFGFLGRVQWTQVTRSTVMGQARVDHIARQEWSYHLDGDSIGFIIACPPEADCAPSPYGAYDSERRTLTVRLPLSESVIVYERTNP